MALKLKNLLPGLFGQTLDVGGGTTIDQSTGAIAAVGKLSGQQLPVIDVTANKSLVAADSGSLVMFDVASGATVTLPAATPGLRFTFCIKTAVTSNAYKVITNTIASEFIGGCLNIPVSTGTTKVFFGDGTSHVSVNLNGTTTGGAVANSGRFTIECLTTGLWMVDGDIEGSGTVATPFSTS